MAAATSMGITVRTLMYVMLIVMAAAFAYVFANNGYASCFDLQSRWMAAAVTDFYINIVVIWAWYLYKEPNRIVAAAVIASTCFVGSIITCGYILVQFFKLSPEESSENPLYFVLVRRDYKKDHVGVSVITARIIVSALGCLMVGMLIYSFIVDASSSHARPIARCMVATLTDIYIHHVILSVWVAYKESSCINAFFWILLLVCFGSITTCVYIVRELLYLSPQQPISLIIFSKSNKDLQSSDPPLMAHPDV